MATTVYAVSDGEYSDYRVLAIFETRDGAEAAISRGIGGDVEEFELYADGDTSLRRRPHCHAYLTVQTDGTFTHEFERADTEIAEESSPSTIRVESHFGGHGYYRVHSTAPTLDAARKAVRERAAQVAAQLIDGLDPLAVTVERR